MYHVRKMEYYSAVKNAVLTDATSMNFEKIILSEISQT